eukprot:5978513-Amphidinium_carterae.1
MRFTYLNGGIRKRGIFCIELRLADGYVSGAELDAAPLFEVSFCLYTQRREFCIPIPFKSLRRNF